MPKYELEKRTNVWYNKNIQFGRKKGYKVERDNRIYIAIDLKSFYASVECVERGLDPLTTNLVVADAERTQKTICLAVSPSLKEYGIPGRARLFEVIEKVKEVNCARRMRAPGGIFQGESSDALELSASPKLSLTYITATPRMAYYMEYSTRIYNIYLKYVAPEDIHVYSVDEVFIDASGYLKTYGLTAKEFAVKMIKDVLDTTGITATAGIGTNLYLAKVAMDIVAKHVDADEDGVRIAELDEMSYRRILWNHTPLTDFWRIGRGYEHRLMECGIYTMGDIARCSVGKDGEYYNEELLYKMFGINAELLIDHAWGYEPCTIADIKAYKPDESSISSGQVLKCPYDNRQARIIVHEMTDLLVLDLVEKNLVTDRIVLTIGYDIENLTNPERRKLYKGPVTTDNYGRKVPKHAHGTINLGKMTSSSRLIIEKALELYDNITDSNLLVRRVTVTAGNVISEDDASGEASFTQLDLFSDYDMLNEDEEKEKNIQKAVIGIKKRYGKNAILKGINLYDDATAVERNNQIGGHKARLRKKILMKI